MTIHLHREFKKRYKKLSKKEQQNTDERLLLFSKDPFNSTLNNHALSGKYKKFRSINITSDLRALYEPIDKNKALFIIIDAHSNLYN